MKKRIAELEKEKHLIEEKFTRLEKSNMEYETKLFGKSLTETNIIRVFNSYSLSMIYLKGKLEL